MPYKRTEKQREYDRNYYAANKIKVYERNRKWALANREKTREYSRRGHVTKKYKLTLEEYDAYLAKPCAMCGEKSEVLDHDHTTGKNREALCRDCNLLLGHAKDSVARLEAGVKYLKKHGD